MSLTINLPFDEAEDSPIAYDYSGNNHHAKIVNGFFIQGRNGNCLYFPGSGMAQITNYTVPFNKNFSILFTAMAEITPVPATNTWLLLKLARNQYVRLDFSTALESWSDLSIIKSGRTFSTYVNSRLTDTKTIADNLPMPVGFCVLNNNGFNNGGRCYIDNFRIYEDQVLTVDEISNVSNLRNMAIPQFLINNINFSSFGVTCSKARGLMDELEMKDIKVANWPGYHGEMVDLAKISYDVRVIELDCWIKGFGRDDYTAQLHAFKAQFRGPHTKRITVKDLLDKPLVYEVYCPTDFKVTEDWSQPEMVGTFTLKLREPEPVKKILKFTRTSEATKQVSISITTIKMVSIYWGDGARSKNVYTSGSGPITLTHDYQNNGDYEIVIAGVIEEILSFETNAVIVWNRL